MRIACLGAGPAGIYFAISMKLRTPDYERHVFERNRAGEAFDRGMAAVRPAYDDQPIPAPYCAGQALAAQRWQADPARAVPLFFVTRPHGRAKRGVRHSSKVRYGIPPKRSCASYD